MTRKRTHGRTRKPRPIIANPIYTAMRGAQSVASNENGIDLKLINHTALEALRQGKASDDDMGALANALNMTRALIAQRKHLGRAHLNDINAAQDHLAAIGRRAQQLQGRYIARGYELESICTVMHLHNQQLDICSVTTLQKAMNTVRGVISSGHAIEVIA